MSYKPTGFPGNMSDSSNDFSDEDGLFSSEDILRSMGFTTSFIGKSVQKIPQCTAKSGSSGNIIKCFIMRMFFCYFKLHEGRKTVLPM